MNDNNILRQIKKRRQKNSIIWKGQDVKKIIDSINKKFQEENKKEDVNEAYNRAMKGI